MNLEVPSNPSRSIILFDSTRILAHLFVSCPVYILALHVFLVCFFSPFPIYLPMFYSIDALILITSTLLLSGCILTVISFSMTPLIRSGFILLSNLLHTYFIHLYNFLKFLRCAV